MSLATSKTLVTPACLIFSQTRLITQSMKKALLLLAFVITACMDITAQTDPLRGMRIGVIGDSYVKNHREPIQNSWHYKFAKRHGMTYYNYGRNGSCVSLDMKVWGPAVVHRYQQMNDSLDIVVVIAGHNDAGRLADAVTDSTTTLTNYREQCTKLCQGLIEKYPKAYIFWFTPWANDNPNFEVIVNTTKEICGSMGIPVFDAYHDSNIFARNDNFRQIFFQGGKRDHAHLNNKGHDRFLPIAEHYILQYMQ